MQNLLGYVWVTVSLKNRGDKVLTQQHRGLICGGPSGGLSQSMKITRKEVVTREMRCFAVPEQFSSCSELKG